MNKSDIFRLTDLEISFVSACPQGANPGAKVMLKKEIVSMKTAIKKEKDGKDPVNVTLDVEALSKSMTESLGKVMADLLSKDAGQDATAMTEAVVAVLAGDIAKVGKDINDQVTKAIADVQKEFNDKLEAAKKESQEDFSKSGEETLTLNGTSFKKSEVGEHAFLAIKASAMQQDALRKEIEHGKAVARVEKEYPNVAGKPEDKAALLMLLEKSDDAVKATGLAVLKALNDAGKEFKKEHGRTNTDDGSAPMGKMSTDTDASAKLDKMAKELAAKENISIASAYTKVLDTAEGEALYNEHRSA